MNPHDEHKLERLIHQVLRELPPRRAPQSLELRVRAAIEQRAALPWWRKSFGHWPMPAQAAFMVLSVGIVVLGMRVAGGLEAAQLGGAILAQFPWLGAVSAVGAVIADFLALVVRSIPPLWLYAGLAFVAVMYATLFGLGAAAYRALYASR